MDNEKLEKYSSAITLSDMEVFVFPELMYSLVLANIMSPIIWQWRQLDCFKKLKDKSPYRKFLRLKQFIMDEYDFNLDLNTWGLTRQEKELERFEKFISPEEIARSNALFGYHGDKYYFDVDIRRHFGLDKYDNDIIPYWKTETVEAMTAFRLKEGYNTGAGECVSLSTLYAAAAFIICGIPLEDIYMVLTPLHSQNFIDIQDGILTNNRRIVTKTMWFNGTAISNKAQRALRNEQVTIVAHSTGYVHCLYDEATINKDVYREFTNKLDKYLAAELNSLIFANFLRSHSEYQQYFQFCRHRRGEAMFVKAEVLFQYEHGSDYRICENGFDKLLAEVSSEDYLPGKFTERMCCEQLMSFVRYEKINLSDKKSREKLVNYLLPFAPDAENLVNELCEFVHVQVSLPALEKTYVPGQPIELKTDQSREEIIEYLRNIAKTNVTAELAVYAYRDMDFCDWQPFIKAGIERNPVSLEAVEDIDVEKAYDRLRKMADASIYDGRRLAQPDEVENYSTGDGVEKAITLANIIKNKKPDQQIKIIIDKQNVVLEGGCQYLFSSNKGLEKVITI